MKKKFLVLGIGNAQVDLIRYLKDNTDFEVHAVSYNSLGRGLKLVDKFVEINIIDKDKIIEYVKNENIDYIYSVGSDLAMPTVAFVSEKLNLHHFVSYETALTCNTKNLTREKLGNVYGNIEFVQINKETDLNKINISFPAMLKPVDSQGQRGVITVKNIDDIKKHLSHCLSFSKREEAILEKKIVGEEISVNAIIKDSEIVFLLPSKRVSFKEFDGGIIHKHILPLEFNNNQYKNLNKLVTSCIERLEIKNGPLYFQIMVNNDDLYLIEVAPRLDGCHMWNLIKHSTGVDLLDITLKLLIKENIDIPKEFNVKPSVLEFICQAPNEKFKGYSKKQKSEFYEPYYEKGKIVNKMNGYIEKCGYEITIY